MTTDVDLLYGVKAIAEFLGLSLGRTRWLIEAKRLPMFKIGGTVCSRRSTLAAWLDELETVVDA